MSIPSAWDEMRVEDLPTSDLQWLAREAGLPVAIAMWRRCAGSSMEFPSRVSKAYAKRFIEEWWDPTDSAASVRELARSLRLSERTIYEYLGERKPDHAEPCRQLALI